MAITLTRVERWILSNQYLILEKISSEEEQRAHYAKVREILENGWELEYDWHIDHVYRDDHCLSSEQCSEVLKILSMFRDLRQSYDHLADKSGIDEHWIQFDGFDGNNESVLIGYCEHVFNEGKFKELRPNRRDGLNSHLPMLDFYRRMVLVWEPLSRKRGDDFLTKEQVILIINAAPHPESPIGELRDAEVKGPVQ